MSIRSILKLLRISSYNIGQFSCHQAIISQITPIYTKYSNNNKKHGDINHSIKRYHHNILAVNVNTFPIEKRS